MRNIDHQAKSQVLKKIISLMGGEMASRSPKTGKGLHVEISHGAGEPRKGGLLPDDDECPHCDGEGCRFCK